MQTEKLGVDERKHLDDLHFEHQVWLSTLAFCKDEIKIFRHRLEEVIVRNTKTDVRAGVEAFENRFIRQDEVIDQLAHDIRAAEQVLVNDVKENPIASDHRFYPDHVVLRDRMTSFEKIYRDTKDEFMRFVATWM